MEYEKMTDNEFATLFCSDDELRYQVLKNMEDYAGSFVVSLAECMHRADRQNLRKLALTFREYINQYLPEKWMNSNHPAVGDVVDEIFRQLEDFGVKEITLDGVRYRKSGVPYGKK